MAGAKNVGVNKGICSSEMGFVSVISGNKFVSVNSSVHQLCFCVRFCQGILPRFRRPYLLYLQKYVLKSSSFPEINAETNSVSDD